MPTAAVRDILLYYEEAGSGDPLVLIGGLGVDLQVWRFQVEEFAKTHRVITLDNRGAGRTSAPDRPYSIAGMAADVAALLGQLAVSKATLIGWSMGGCIAQELAISQPGVVERLVLIASMAANDGFLRARLSGMIDIRRSNLSREQQVRVMAPWQ